MQHSNVQNHIYAYICTYTYTLQPKHRQKKNRPWNKAPDHAHISEKSSADVDTARNLNKQWVCVCVCQFLTSNSVPTRTTRDENILATLVPRWSMISPETSPPTALAEPWMCVHFMKITLCGMCACVRFEQGVWLGTKKDHKCAHIMTVHVHINIMARMPWWHGDALRPTCTQTAPLKRLLRTGHGEMITAMLKTSASLDRILRHG